MSENPEQSALSNDTTTASEPANEKTSDSKLFDELPPDRLLDTRNLQLIIAGLRMEDDPKILHRYLAYEQSHQDRNGVKRDIRQEIQRAGGDLDQSSAPADGNNDSAPVSDTVGEEMTPEAVLKPDDLGAIRDHLKEVTDRDLLRRARAREQEQRARQAVVDAIDLRLEALD
jgi:hypothetical protein